MNTLITGAGGSIGSALARHLLIEHGHERLALFDLSEYGLWQLEHRLGTRGEKCEFILGDVRDQPTLMRILERYNIHRIFHCAALKHVPMMESPFNALEGIKTNVVGTDNVIAAAHLCHVGQLVIISTDKAVKPISMMGATKTFVERLAHEHATTNAGTLQTVIVRFGNVQGSSGSVLMRWADQVKAGQPITVTDEHMMRYFMSIEEAVSLVVESAKIASMDETSSQMYMLDMGDLQSVDALARRKYPDYPIIYTGIRPGEKLVEELIDPTIEHRMPTRTQRIWKIMRMHQARPNEYRIMAAAIKELAREGDFNATLQVLRAMTGYSSSTIWSAGL